MNQKKFRSNAKVKIRLVFVWFILLSVLYSDRVALAGESDIMRQGAGHSAILYDNSNGLPTSEANAVAQTKDGFIWIGSYSGLIRYDGNEFYRYDATEGIASVMSLYVDSQDRLWIGTNDNGVVLYEEGEFRSFGRNQRMPSLSVRSIVEDGAGNIILATTQGLAYVDSEYQLYTLEDSRIEQKYICEIKADAEGTVYGSILDGAFFTMENLQVAAYYTGQELGIGVVSCICPDTKVKGQVYLGTEESSVICGNMSTGMKDYEKISVSPQVNINAIYPAEDGKIWICADNGIGYLNGGTDYVNLKNIPMNNSVDEMMIDHEGNPWFVSSRQGVMKVVDNPFADVTLLAGLEKEVVNTTCLYQGELYVGSDIGLRVIGQDYEQKKTKLTKLLDGIRIRCIQEDSAGNLWLCTYSDKGLVCYRGDETYTLYNTDVGLKSNRVRDMVELSNGTIAVASSGGVNLIENGKITATYDEKDGIINTEILSICEGEDGTIYLGSDGGGIYRLENGAVSNLGVEDGLESEIILRIKKDTKRSIYWIITSNSISYMKEGEIKTLKNFPYSNNFDMYFDQGDGVWILSSNGIYVVNGEQLLADSEPEYFLYDIKSGLPSVPTANSRSCLCPDGTLYISGVLGVSEININEAKNQEEKVQLIVPFIEMDGRTVHLNEGEPVSIPSDCRRLTIHGYAITYSLQNPHVSYYLEGFDEGRISLTKQEMQAVSYTNLHSGKYTFHLSVMNAITGVEENGIVVTLTKEKAFYERWQFWLLTAIVFVFLLVVGVQLYTHYKTAKLVRKQNENKLFIRQMIHAFATSIDLKDKYTNGHSFRVAEYAKQLAEKMGYDKSAVEDVYNIGLLHDIGKITIPDDILNKPGRLDEEEFKVMKQHSKNGYDILKEIEIAPELALGAGYHHERIDGKGYPSGIEGENIPRVAQIIAVADTFDAMNSTRPYRKQMKMEEIVEELKRVAGTQLSEDIVEVLLDLIESGEISALQ